MIVMCVCVYVNGRARFPYTVYWHVHFRVYDMCLHTMQNDGSFEAYMSTW